MTQILVLVLVGWYVEVDWRCGKAAPVDHSREEKSV
jgi:hypothetical protein